MALSAAEKTAIKRALLFYKSYMDRTMGGNILSDADLEGAFQDADIGGSNFLTKVAALREALTSLIAPPMDGNSRSLIEAA